MVAGFARLLALAVGFAITSWLALPACWAYLLGGFARTWLRDDMVAGFARLLALAVGFAITCWLALPACWPCSLAGFARKLAS